MTYFAPALLKAAAVNAGLILDLLDNGACPTRGDIKRLCAAEGYADDASIDIALRQVIDDGYVVAARDAGITTYHRTFARRDTQEA